MIYIYIYPQWALFLCIAIKSKKFEGGRMLAAPPSSNCGCPSMRMVVKVEL
jgi:hypothetical protein